MKIYEAENLTIFQYPELPCYMQWYCLSLQLSRDEECPMWRPPSNPFTVEVKDPEKKKKFKGIKSFVAYQVIPSVHHSPHTP